jgi:hypothetical protein
MASGLQAGTAMHACIQALPSPPCTPLDLQSDNPQNPHGLAHAWTLLARLLNALPANRVTATAVDATLKVGGGCGAWVRCTAAAHCAPAVAAEALA